jgi:hypothetical protein
MLSSGVVFLASRIGISTQTFALLNVLLVGGWVVAVLAIGKENTRRANEGDLVNAEPLRA